MAKLKPVKVNLSTKSADVLATIREEQPKAWYYFRKKYGSKLKYEKAEDQMLDKALEEKCDQFTDIDYWISPVGNRWMTYVQVQYFPKAHYALAFHYSFIYYETFSSCGAFFPMYSPKQTKDGKVKKKGVPDSVIRYTDHFFYQMSERTKIEYRSKELIRKFISERCEHALTTDEDGEVVLKFKGGHGFGKEIAKRPQFIDCRTFLRDEELNNKQKRMCEPVDMLYELTKDGMFIKDVALNTAFYQDYTEEEAAKEGMKKLTAIKKLGMEKHMLMMAAIHMSFVRILEDILHIKLDMNQQAVISHVVGECGKDLVAKWVGQDASSPEKDKEFQDDLIEVMVKCAKKLKLRYVNRESITKRMNEIREEANQENKESN